MKNTLTKIKKSDQNINQMIIDNYISTSGYSNIDVQMEMVQTMISRFSNIHKRELDQLIMHYFPDSLYLEFHKMSASGNKVGQYKEKKNLLFDIFNFIFRNSNLVCHYKTKYFIEFFVNFIKTPDENSSLEPNKIIDSINMSLYYEVNKVIFINSNAMYYVYNFCNINGSILEEPFWTVCENIYDIKGTSISFINCQKLSNSVHEIMTKFGPSREDCARLIFIVFHMIIRLKLVDGIEFDIGHLYGISLSTLLRYIHRGHDSDILVNVSQIWGRILNASKNTVHIDSIDKLIFFASLYSIELSSELRNIIDGSEDMLLTDYFMQKLNIIYFSFVSFPLINQNVYTWFQKVLTDLHTSFQLYFESEAMKNLSIRHQYIIVQYYLKSLVTLNISISSHVENILKGFLKKYGNKPYYKLHFTFIESHFVFDISDISENKESDLDSHLIKIKNFLNDLIVALTDVEYINIVKSYQKLSMYEEQPLCNFSMINIDFIRTVFEGCATRLIKDNQNMIPEINENDEYITYKKVMNSIILSFNESIYLEKQESENYIKMCDYHSHISELNRSKETNDNLSESVSSGNNSEKAYLSQIPTFQTLLTWFCLIYEMKFIFDHMNSQFGKF
ncbi:hypothetical protein RF11_07531 [Thelohanellus kitauei]|uniref:Uncharacterized protein n=1 Tax=Thelohanellus kitauei TaxID=669202 RepID=A0A0C2I9H8_THEKT|nr:hypothetical protein RF11_07531 [Thelohanellus kitauei]